MPRRLKTKDNVVTHNDRDGMPRVKPGPIGWLDNRIRESIEELVSGHEGRAWKITSEKDFSEFACHHCAIVADGSFEAFFKYSEADNARQQFEIELSGLRTLSQRTGVLVPQPIGVVCVNKGTLLIMEALEAIERGPRQWRQIGETLARIHTVTGDYCGFETNGYCGPLYQDNTPVRNWVTFFRERRLLPRLEVAIDSGNLPVSMAEKIENLAERLPDLAGPEITPVLLHGDAQQNNFISTARGTYVIDPAIYYGHPEADLALIDSFQPAPQSVIDGYRDEMPIDSGFIERRDLWRIPLYLAAVALEGSMHLKKLMNALQKYL